MYHFLTNPPPFLFFTGKGGVGKTSLACASAVALCDAGKRVLLVSTDPASNVGQVFATDIGNRITAIAAVPGLSALEIDPPAAAKAYRERIVGPVRGKLPERVVRSIEEQLSGACTTEIAAFDEFTALLTDPALRSEYDHILFDTAPTGHTIRLLQLPGAWSEFLAQGKGMPPAWARWRGWRNSAASMPRPSRRWPTTLAPGWCWWRAPSTPPCGKWPAPTRSWRPSAWQTSNW